MLLHILLVTPRNKAKTPSLSRSGDRGVTRCCSGALGLASELVCFQKSLEVCEYSGTAKLKSNSRLWCKFVPLSLALIFVLESQYLQRQRSVKSNQLSYKHSRVCYLLKTRPEDTQRHGQIKAQLPQTGLLGFVSVLDMMVISDAD